MREVDCSTLYLPFLAKELGYFPTVFAQCITCVDKGKPIAGVIYDGYTGMSISAHIWVAEGRVPSREWLCAIMDYPFNRLCVTKVVGEVLSSNVEASKLDEHLGFVEEARITQYSENGDLILYTMTKEQCRVLTHPRWEKTRAVVARRAA